MEDPIRDSDRESHHASDQSKNSANASSSVSGATERSTDGIAAGDVVTVCAWCPVLNILKLDRWKDDQFFFIVGDKLEMAYRKRRGEQVKSLAISDGICPSCIREALLGS